jgi:hypothetical protein
MKVQDSGAGVNPKKAKKTKKKCKKNPWEDFIRRSDYQNTSKAKTG